MVSISGISSLGDVNSESIVIDNNLMNIPRPNVLPNSDTSTVSVINLLGKIRRITLSGIFEGTNAEITAFVDDIEDWVNDGRQSARTYTSSFSGSFSVLCDSFNYDYSIETPFHITWSMELIEGSALGFITGT